MIDLNFKPEVISFAKKMIDEQGMWVPKAAREMMGEQKYIELQAETKYCVSLMLNDNFMEHVTYLSNTRCHDIIPSEEITTLRKHYEKMYKTFSKPGQLFSNNDFYPLAIKSMDTFCYCRKLEAPFDIYNKGRFLDGSDIYKLSKKGSKDSIITTKRKPFATKESDLESEQATLIPESSYEAGCVDVKIKNKFIGTPNRFAIFLSTKPPVEHSGLFCILTSAGQAIYIYAFEFNGDLKLEKRMENRAGQWNNASIIIGYGFKSNVLEQTLVKSVNYLKGKVGAKLIIMVRPDKEFEEKINWFEPLPEDEEVSFDF